MKKEELTAIGLTDEQANEIFALNGKDIEKHKGTAERTAQELEGLKGQLTEANKAVEAFKGLDVEGIKSKAAEWEQKYNADTKALHDQLAAKDYAQSVSALVSGVMFSSESAKKAFLSDLTAAQLPVKDGALLGFDDFQKKYAETDPKAFVTQTEGSEPVFTKQSTTQQAAAPDAVLRAAMGLTTKE